MYKYQCECGTTVTTKTGDGQNIECPMCGKVVEAYKKETAQNKYVNSYIAGKSVKQIAALNGVTESTVRQHIIRGYEEEKIEDIKPLLVKPEYFDDVNKYLDNRPWSGYLRELKEAFPDCDYDTLSVIATIWKKAHLKK